MLGVALVVGLIVMLARSASVVQVTSETFDEDFHLLRGLAEWTNLRHSQAIPIDLNDPPVGELVLTLPLYLAGCTIDGIGQGEDPSVYQYPKDRPLFWIQRIPGEMLRHTVSAWKCLLMLPGLGAAFLWTRRLYGPAAGWLAWGLLLFEPTIAAMLPLATLDTLGLSFVLFAAYLVWRYIETPTFVRMAAASAATALALGTKHTAVALPAYAVVSAVLVWGFRCRLMPLSIRPHFIRSYVTWTGRIIAAAGLTLLFMWPMTKFDVSRPVRTQSPTAHGAEKGVDYREVPAPEWQKRLMPLGSYVGSFLQGQHHNRVGHKAYLRGERYGFGRWYYFPVAAAYKMPAPNAIVMLLALATLAVVRPSLRELPLWVAAAAWTALMMTTTLNIGWRHALVPYALLLIAATRCVAVNRNLAEDQHAAPLPPRGRWGWWLPAGVAFLAVGASAAHSLAWHPNYIPYTNLPREKPWLALSDSNVDWGQAAKQADKWVEAHRAELPQPIYFAFFGSSEHGRNMLADAPRLPTQPLPRQGTLVISPVLIVNPYVRKSRPDVYKELIDLQPLAEIGGGSLLVYDLSKLPPVPSPVPTSKPSP